MEASRGPLAMTFLVGIVRGHKAPPYRDCQGYGANSWFRLGPRTNPHPVSKVTGPLLKQCNIEGLAQLVDLGTPDKSKIFEKNGSAL